MRFFFFLLIGIGPSDEGFLRIDYLTLVIVHVALPL